MSDHDIIAWVSAKHAIALAKMLDESKVEFDYSETDGIHLRWRNRVAS